MKYILLYILVFIGLTSPHPLEAQKKRKRVKPVYYGKLQGGYMVDKFIPKGYAGFNYLNLGLRKVTGKKVRESGFEAFYYKEVHDRKIINQFYTIGNQQTGFGLNYYHYLMLQQWNLGKLNIQTGPQFSFGYYRNRNRPFSSHNFSTVYNDYKIGGLARVELSYKIDERYSFILGAQYTLFQFGLRRVTTENPNLTVRQKLEDFLQFDFLVNKYTAYTGIVTQFGKVKVNRTKIAKKKKEQREKQAAKNAEKKKKRDEQIQKRRAKVIKKKAKKNKK